MERKKGTMSKESLNRRLDRRRQSGGAVSTLAALRLERGMTQVQLAELTGMNQSYIARIETGYHDIGQITMNNGLTLAKVLGCRMEDLMKKVQ